MTQLLHFLMLDANPEPKPAWRWRLILLPLAVALLGLVIATAAAKWGYREATEQEVLKAQLKLEQLGNGALRSGVFGGAEMDRLREESAALEAKIATLQKEVSAFKYFSRWDAQRYEEIVDQGYAYHQPTDPAEVREDSHIDGRLKNVVWYPLYPVLGMAVRKITGFSTAVSLNIISLAALFLAAPLFFIFARRHFANRLAAPGMTLSGPNGGKGLEGAETAAFYATALLLLGPCSYFLDANFTEGLFVLLLASFLYCLQSRSWFLAAVIAGVASSSRSQGVLFGPVLALAYLLRGPIRGPVRGPVRGPGLGRDILKRLPMAILLGVISATGLIAWMVYQQATWHDAMAFMHAQKTWNVGINAATLKNAINPLHAFTNFYGVVFPPPGYATNFPAIWEASCVLWPPVVLVLGRRLLTFELGLMGWLLWGLPYISNGLTGYPPDNPSWMSMGRFMSVAIPLHLVLGYGCLRWRWVGPLMVAASAAAFGVFAFKGGGNWWLG